MTNLRVLSWNLAYFTPGHYKTLDNRARQWALLGALQPDIALLQECRPSDFEFYGGEALKGYEVIGKIPPGWTGCSALLIRTGLADIDKIEPAGVVLEHEHEYVVAAKAMIDGRSVLVASVHAAASAIELSDEERKEMVVPPYTTTPYHCDAILAALDTVRAEYDGFIIGGDWNCAPSMDDQPHFVPATARQFFAHATTLGWNSATSKHHPDEVRTWYRGDEAPYQLDHIFTDAATYDASTSCDALAAPFIPTLSDHAPLIADFQLG